MRRPNPLQWLWYSLGGRLPREYREWVLHDVTARTWLLRHLVRVALRLMVPLVLLYVLFSILGGPLDIIVMALVLGLIVGMYYSLSYASESNDARLTRYGFPPRFGSTIRDNRFSGEDDPTN
jgi:Family of unknown function (DUF5313)